MEQIFLAYGLSEVTVTSIMTLYKNTKVIVCLPNEDTDLFAIVAESCKELHQHCFYL